MNASSFAKVTISPAPHRRAWSIPEICVTLNVSRGFVHGQIRQGLLRARKLGRRVVILNEDLEDYLTSSLK